MTEQEKIKIQNYMNDYPEELCDFCKFNLDCTHDITCYYDIPVEPPCNIYNNEELFDEESILEKIKELESEI